MEKVLEQLANGKRAHLTAFVVLGIFLGVQYADFKARLTRIEDRIQALENGKHVAIK